MNTKMFVSCCLVSIPTNKTQTKTQNDKKRNPFSVKPNGLHEKWICGGHGTGRQPDKMEKTNVPLVRHAGRRIYNVKKYYGKPVYLSGADALLPDVIIQTTMEQIEDMINTTTKEDAKMIMSQVWNAIKNVNVDAIYAEKGQAWSNLMDDILIFYTCRFVLFNMPMPIVANIQG